MNTRKLGFLLLFLGTIIYHHSVAQVQRYPANVTPILGLPYSLYLSDYTDPGKEQLTANIIFNDFNEPSWTFRLKLRLEGADIRIATSPNFVPSQPIIASPGQPVRFSGEDWFEYFDYRNIQIDGVGRKQLLESGRLPEGGYTLYLQVLDYHTGEALSRETPVSFWVGLLNPPMFITPQENAFVNPISTQTPFTWQLFNGGSPNNVLGNEYEFTLWEITENSIPIQQIDPLSATQNGQALQIYQSDRITTTSLLYGLAEPPLEPGKAYIYQVRAFSLDGRDYFKNEGKSEFRKFYYGWPTGGKIDPKFPGEGHVIGLDEQATVQWHAPDNQLPGQNVRYTVRIAEVDEGEDPKRALEGELWHFHETSASASPMTQTHIIPAPTIAQKYAWEVIAYSDEQEVARSNINSFFGPPLMEQFFAGIHRIEVYSINNDQNDLTGTGKVRLAPGLWTDISFEHLKLKRSGMLWVLDEGEILIEQNKTQDLSPMVEVNGTASFISDKFRLNKDGLYIHGHVEWPLHLASFSSERSVVVSNDDWFSYNEFYLVGGTTFSDKNSFDLLDPFGFNLQVSPASMIYFYEGSYKLELNGYVSLPEKIKGAMEGERVKIPFQGKNQLYYFDSDDISVLSPIYVSDKINILLESESFTVDLSEEQSPGAFADDDSWKGIAYKKASLAVPSDFDPRNHIRLPNEIVFELNTPTDGSALAYVSDGGLFFETTQTFPQNQPISFNTFPGTAEELTIAIENSELTEKSLLTGNGYIPILSENEPFDFFVPINAEGLTVGYFEGLEGYQFIHNPDNEEQRVVGTVQRAVFEDYERLNFTLDLDWPSLDISMKGLRYFKAWGNYNVGFYTPEGLFALDQQITTQHHGYPVTIDAVAVGRSSGMYGFGVSGKIVLGDDVAGNEGAPSFNMYSLVKNKVLPGTYTPTKTLVTEPPEPINAEAEKAKVEAEIAAETSNALQSLDSQTQTMSDGISGEVETQAMEWESGTDVLPEDMIDTSEGDNSSGVNWQDEEVAKTVIMEMIRLHAELATDSKWNPYSKAILELDEEERNTILPNFKSLPEQVSTGAADLISEEVVAPIDREMQKLTNGINNSVNSMVGGVNRQVEELVNGLVDKASADVIASLGEIDPEVASIVNDMATKIKRELILEVNSSINESVYDNITFPVTTLLQDELLGNIEYRIRAVAEQTVKATFTPGSNPTDAFANALKGLDNEMVQIGQDIIGLLKPDQMAARVQALGSDAVRGISGARIVGRLSKAAKEAIAQYAANKAIAKGTEIANKVLSEELGVELPLDIGGGVMKLMQGGSLKDAVLADPITVKVRSQAMDFNGTLFMTEDHPIYGDVFSASVDVQIKVPDKNNPINIQGAYMNGRKDGSAYWFVDIGGTSSMVEKKTGDSFEAPKGMEKVGGEMDKGFNTPKTNINLGIMSIVALRGRVYKHMQGDGLSGLVPDPGNKFGAYLHMVMFGPKKGDLLRMEVEGEVNTSTDGNLELDFFGAVQVANNAPRVEKPDESASIQGTVTVRYNKHEKHFFGYATVKLISDGMCGEGSLLVDVKPGYWRVALGNREDRIGIIPGCAGMAYYGWVDLQSEYVEVGAGIGLALYKDVGIDLKVAAVGLIISAGVNVNAFASVNYKPLTVREIGVFVEAWAYIAAWYKLPLKKKKTIDLVDVYLYASSIMRFYPSPTILYGTLEGKIKLIKIIKLNFKKNYEIDI